ncbi:MAG: Aminodeoxychorismate synthase component 2 [Chlamydiae bacterium]|nr:Aminodeoxychorismate synthase component 2 [Chlamydiota bacterium]
MIVLIDNYDSFTYNLYQLLARIYSNIKVIRNDHESVDQIAKMNPKAIVISPGPGTPENAGICVDLIKKLGPTTPILGVCLGMQAMAYAYGGTVIRATKCVHGKSALIFHRRQGIFEKIKLPFNAARYHSLVVDSKKLPKELIVEALSKDDLIMALRHLHYPMWGVQFHPESILSEQGEELISNFLKFAHII